MPGPQKAQKAQRHRMKHPTRREVLGMAAATVPTHAAGPTSRLRAIAAHRLGRRPANTLRFFPGFSVEARQDVRRRDQSRARRLGSAAAAAARRAADARLVAAGRAGAGQGLHGRRARPARLRRQQQAARRREPRQLLEARDGARSGRGDEELRLRQVRRSSATIAAAASAIAWRSITPTR